MVSSASQLAQPSPIDPTHLETFCARGIERCRRGDWQRGIDDLMQVVGQKQRSSVPSLLYSYLGLGIAQYRSEIKEGLKLCKHAVKLEFFQPDNYYNLARVHLIAQQRSDAVAAVRRGLDIDPDHGGLQRLQAQLGIRRRQLLPFLSRQHFLNQLLGRLRHRLRTHTAKTAAQAREKAETHRATPGEGQVRVG
jgi:tetratricopeptide (TPR) repeat protein